MKRVLLNEKNFIDLISGKIVEIGGVQIALQDIGYDRIEKATLNVIKNG